MNKKLLFFTFVLLMVGFVNASQIIFNEYEINKLSEIISKDCKSSSFLYICTNNWGDLYDLVNDECINSSWSDRQNEIINFGELQKYYQGELVNLDFHEGKEGGGIYSVRVNQISKEDVKEYLIFLNRQVVIGYANFPFITCYINKSNYDSKALTTNEYNQKYWGGKLIKEAKVFVQIGDLTINIYLFGIGISFFSVSLTIFVIFLKKQKRGRKLLERV